MGQQKVVYQIEIPAHIAQLMAQKVKVLEVRDFEVANACESSGEYRIDRLSESRNSYILFRRERDAPRN